MGRLVFKVVIDPKSPNPMPALLAKSAGDQVWKAAYFSGNDLVLKEETVVTPLDVLGFKVLGTWEIEHV